MIDLEFISVVPWKEDKLEAVATKEFAAAASYRETHESESKHHSESHTFLDEYVEAFGGG